MKPADPTIYTIMFEPKNPIPPQGTIVIGWPDKVQVEDDVNCIVTTNAAVNLPCTVDQSQRLIIIENVVQSTLIPFYAAVTIELKFVTNPLNNKE